MGFFSGALGAIGSIAGGLIGSHNSNKIAAQNIAMQKEFAQNGIRWKVEDAKRAGIHPLFALGANTASYSPVSGYGGDYGISDALSGMGQSIDRAKQAKMTPAEKAVQELQHRQLYDLEVRQKEANIALTQAQISATVARTQQQVPSMPSLYGSGEIISGQAQSYPTSQTSVSPAEVTTSLKGGFQQAGMNPDIAYLKTKNGYAVVPSNPAKQATEDNAVAEFQWALRNNFSPTPPPFKPRKGTVWLYNPLTGVWKMSKTNSEYVEHLKRSFGFK